MALLNYIHQSIFTPMFHIRFVRLVLGILLSGLHTLSNQAVAAPVDGARWVSGVNVNLRSEASLDAVIIKRLAINTQVKLTLTPGEGSKFCQVETLSSEKGFVACQYLSVKAITHEQVSSETSSSGKPNSDFNPERAFWLKPSASELIAFAGHLTVTRLTPAQLNAEAARKPQDFKFDEKSNQTILEPILQRPKVPELEAMKEHLAKGIVAPRAEQPLIAYKNLQKLEKLETSLSTNIKQKASRNPAEIARASEELEKFKNSILDNSYYQTGYFEELVALSKHISLPKVATSYFTHAREVVPPGAQAEQVSAAFSVPHTVQTSSGPRWLPGGHYGDIHIGGAWDFGIVKVQLAQPVKRTTIFRSGKLEVNDDRLLRSWYISDDSDESCPPGFAFGKPSVNMSTDNIKYDDKQQITKVIPRTPYFGNALFHFYTSDQIKTDRAQIKHIRSNRGFSLEKNPGVQPFSSSELMLVDLDLDGIADLAVWEGTGQSSNEIHAPVREDPYLRLFFVNIKGEWFYFDRDEYVYGCGC